MNPKPVKKLGFGSVAGLNLGVDALSELTTTAQHRVLGLEYIHVVPGHNPRGEFDPTAFDAERLDGLVHSLRDEGVLNPIWVRPHQGGYAVIAGERRFHAANLAGLREIPSLVFNVDLEKSALLALLENGQREQLSLLDETFAGFRAMEARTGLNRHQLVAHLNQLRKGRETDQFGLANFLQSTFNSSLSVWAQHRSKVFEFLPEELEAVLSKTIDFSVAVAITKIPSGPARTALLERAIHEKLNATEVQKFILNQRPVASQTLAEDIRNTRQMLGQVSKLQGEKAERARQLLAELRTLLQ